MNVFNLPATQIPTIQLLNVGILTFAKGASSGTLKQPLQPLKPIQLNQLIQPSFKHSLISRNPDIYRDAKKAQRRRKERRETLQPIKPFKQPIEPLEPFEP